MPINADYQHIVMDDGTDRDAMVVLVGQNAQIIALLTEIRDDQRQTVADTSQGKVVKTKALSVSIL